MKINSPSAFLAGVFLTSLGFYIWSSKTLPEPVVAPSAAISTEIPPLNPTQAAPTDSTNSISQNPAETESVAKASDAGDSATCPPATCQCDPVKKKGPLVAPVFHMKTPLILETNQEGEVRVQWEEVIDANGYQVKLLNLKNKVVRTWKTTRTLVYLKQLPFEDDLEITPYKVVVSALTESGKEGPPSKPRELRSKRLRSVVAPRIEAIIVED